VILLGGSRVKPLSNIFQSKHQLAEGGSGKQANQEGYGVFWFKSFAVVFPGGKSQEKKCRSREILCSASSNVSMDFCQCVIFIGVRPNLRDIESFNVFLRSLLDPIFQPGGRDLAGGGAPCQES